MPVLPETTQTQKDTHMSWSDSLKNALGGLVGQAEQNLINTYLTKVICDGDVSVNPRFGTWSFEQMSTVPGAIVPPFISSGSSASAAS